MAQHSTPHFHNQPGVAQIRIGAKEFMCIGALPPFDHPHVYLDMGASNEAVCPYCSTHYVYDALCAAAPTRPNASIASLKTPPPDRRSRVNAPIVIAGAGIGGLAAALSLARAGKRTLVLERAARIDEVGAGLQIAPERRARPRQARARAGARRRRSGARGHQHPPRAGRRRSGAP